VLQRSADPFKVALDGSKPFLLAGHKEKHKARASI
jgi:hypothetical protein